MSPAPGGLEAFEALDLRVGTVREVLAFPEAARAAWKIRVDFGPERGLLWTSAQATGYPAEALMGRQVVGVLGIGPKRIAGFVSQFLLLGAYGDDAALRLLGPDGEVPPGAKVL